ncbi:MFS transporter [Cryobacterium sp. TMT4-31]|uniref:MFS transporter n=1 Tax=Cryobacterium sp. TMT4-31 TaxID=1259259 RepID=UPI001F540560|nr:MFS transporter [Cryobacterium sp. TMT4-31]
MDDLKVAPVQHRWLILGIVGLAQLMVILDAFVINIALPSAQTDLGFSDADRQWVVTAYALTFGSLLLLGGRLSDLLGHKRTFIIGLIGFAAASAIGGAATNFGALIAARALQGVFGALLAPTALAVLVTTFTVPKERARAFGIFGAIAGAGGAIGLLLGGWLTETLDWRWTLYINVPIAVIALIGGVLFVTNVTRSGPRPKLDIPGTVLVSGSLFGIVYGLSSAETRGWASPWTWGVLVTAAALLTAFVLWQGRARHPLLPLAVIRDRDRGGAYIALLVAGAGMFGVFLFVTYYLQLSLYFTPIQTGLSFLPMIVMLTVSAQLSTSVLVPRVGPKVIVPSAMILAAAGMILLTSLTAESTYLGNVLGPLMILGLAMGAIIPAAMEAATVRVQDDFAGVTSAMVNTSQQIGGSIGTALLNTIAASATTAYLSTHAASPDVERDAAIVSYATAYWWSAAIFASGAILTALLFRRHGHGILDLEQSSAVGRPAVPTI